MGKHYTPTSVSGGNQTQTTLNQNFSDIESALEDCKSLSGLAPNTHSDVNDLNSQRSINAADGIENSDLVTLRQLSGVVSLPGQAETFTAQTVGPHTGVGDMTPIATIAIEDGKTVTVKATVNAINTSAGHEYAAYDLIFSVKRFLGSSVAIGSVAKLYEVESHAGLDATIVLSGDNIIVLVGGNSASPVNWTAVVLTTTAGA